MKMDNGNSFRKIFIVQSTQHDISALTRYSDSLIYLSSGYEETEHLYRTFTRALEDFDPDTDAIIPIGKLIPNVFLGSLLASFPRVILGVYDGKNKDYYFEEVNFGKSQ